MNNCGTTASGVQVTCVCSGKQRKTEAAVGHKEFVLLSNNPPPADNVQLWRRRGADIKSRQNQPPCRKWKRTACWTYTLIRWLLIDWKANTGALIVLSPQNNTFFHYYSILLILREQCCTRLGHHMFTGRRYLNVMCVFSLHSREKSIT